MRVTLTILAIFSFLYTACSTKPKAKLCTVVIPEPSKAELNKFKADNFGKK